jgi:dephospho-CoA kinase
MLREFGAKVIEADALGRTLMEPGQEVYRAIVRAFGPEVVGVDGRLKRARLAELAFQGGRLNELNGIVHPAVIGAQREWMDAEFAADPAAVAVVESALIFEVERDARARGEEETVLADWKRRIDRVIVVTAPDDVKVARYAARTRPDGSGRAAAEAEARVRLGHQIPDSEKAARADYVIENTGDFVALKARVMEVWEGLKAESNKASNKSGNTLSLE